MKCRNSALGASVLAFALLLGAGAFAAQPEELAPATAPDVELALLSPEALPEPGDLFTPEPMLASGTPGGVVYYPGAPPGTNPDPGGTCFSVCWATWDSCTLGCAGLQPPEFGVCWGACRDARRDCLQACPVVTC